MNTTKLDPTSLGKDHPLAVALRLVSRHWFLAYSKLLSLDWQWSRQFPYGATDGATLILNPDGIDKLAKQPNGIGLIAFLLVHESLHALLGHGWRLVPLTNRMAANEAADYIINAMIAMRNRELKKEVFPLIEGVLLDESLSGDKSVEQLYRELNRPQPPQPQPQPQPQPDTTPKDDKQDSDSDGSPDDDSSDKSPNDDSGDGDSDSGDSDSGDGDSDSDSGDSDSDSGDGDSDSGDSDSGDSDSGDGDSGNGNGNGDGEAPQLGDDDLSDFVGKGGSDTFAPSPENGQTLKELVDKIEEINDRLLMGDEIDRRTMGDSGKTGQRVASQRVDSAKLDWVEMTREWLLKRSRNGWDSPFNQAIHGSTGLVCAGRRTKAAGEIVLVLDSSGSVSQPTYTKFLLQAQSILDELKPERLHVLSVSHVVADARTFESGDLIPNDFKGGGGTKFKPAFDWVATNVDDPDVLIYLTDGWSTDLPCLTPVDYPVLWLSTSRTATDFKTGDVIEITDI